MMRFTKFLKRIRGLRKALIDVETLKNAGEFLEDPARCVKHVVEDLKSDLLEKLQA